MWFGLPHEFPQKLHTLKKKEEGEVVKRGGGGDCRAWGRRLDVGGETEVWGGHVQVGTILKPVDQPSRQRRRSSRGDAAGFHLRQQ